MNNVEFCDEDVTKATCDGNGGVWDVFDTCPCPVYQSTHAPAGQVGVYNFGLDVTEQPCVRFAVVGDDYSAVNATQYVLVETFSFVGGVECTGDGGMTIEFYDDSTEPPTFVARSTTDFTCPDDGGANSWILTFTTPFYLPPTGFVTFAPGVGETVTLLTTDQALIGTNNDALLWVNDEDDSSFLSPEDPDVLAFELGGTQVPDVPNGACCNQTTGACEAKVEWICEADGGTWFDTIGQVDVCDPDPCTTGACCFAADVCVDTYTLGADCTGDGGTWMGYGSDCNPSCCDTVVDIGRDSCDAANAVALTVNVPPLFGPDGFPDTGDEVATYHIVTNNSGATYDPEGNDCSQQFDAETEDLGWFFAFDLIDDQTDGFDCARVTVDICCTETEPDGIWTLLQSGCNESGGTCGNWEGRDEYGYGPSEDDPACDDDNLWYRFSEVTSGLYQIPVPSDQLIPGAFGDYHYHITVEACTTRACCLADGCPSTCIQTTQGDCEAQGGYYLAESPTCSIAPCLRGACCPAPGECDDNSEAGWLCDDPLLPCDVEDWLGGARCADDPCPVCAFQDAEHCILMGDPDTISRADRDVDGDDFAYITADDFVAAATGDITEICWHPGFTDAAGTCDPAGIDYEWQVWVYNDGGGLPVEPAIVKMDIPFANVVVPAASMPASYAWELSATLPTGIPVVQGNAYWIAINGAGGADCNLWWQSSTEGNGYGLVDGDGTWGKEDINWVGVNGNVDVDSTFCLDIGIDGAPSIDFACCWPDGSCEYVDGRVCHFGPDGIELTEDDGAVWPTFNCPGDGDPIAGCVPPPPNDHCENAIDLVGLGLVAGTPLTTPYYNFFTDTDGPNRFNCDGGGVTVFASDIWYSVTAPAAGTLLVEQCNECSISGEYCHPTTDPCGPTAGECVVNNDYDGFVDAFTGGCGDVPTNGTYAANYLACSDEDCQSEAIGGPGWIEFPVVQDGDYLIRLGGWYGTSGSGTHQGNGEVTFLLTPTGNEVNRPDVVMWTATDSSVGGACTTDADCCGNPCEGYCVPQDGGAFPGRCYGPQHRYLSLDNTINDGTSTAMRVSLQGGGAGPWWVGEPAVGGAGLMMASLQATPYYSAAWPAEVNVVGCEVASAQTYLVQAIVDGASTGDEGNYSSELEVRTPSTWGDTVSTCFGNVCYPADGAGGIDDILASIAKFQGINNAPLTWLDIDPSTGTSLPNQQVNIGDILGSLDGFQGKPYPGNGPGGC